MRCPADKGELERKSERSSFPVDWKGQEVPGGGLEFKVDRISRLPLRGYGMCLMRWP